MEKLKAFCRAVKLRGFFWLIACALVIYILDMAWYWYVATVALWLATEADAGMRVLLGRPPRNDRKQ